jgi:hypothetical protein
MTTDTPRTDACPHCGAKTWEEDTGFRCSSDYIAPEGEDCTLYRTSTCYANENSQLKAEVERLKAIKPIKLSIRPYSYECGDGCCHEYGETWFVDGEEVASGPCDANRLQQLLNHLGYDASIVNENEEGEEVCEI